VLGACVAGLPDAEWGQLVGAVVVLDPAAGPGPLAPGRAEALRAAVRAELGRSAVPRVLVAVPEIPLRGIGKPDRAAVAAVLATSHPGG
jgi:O-succinylbenzoic acid--CoA ligase